MEYYIGFAFAIFVVVVLVKLQEKFNIFYEFSTKNIILKQSHFYNFKKIKSHSSKKINKKRRQSTLHDSRTNIKVIIMDDQAYWIKDNIFYTANMYNGNVDKDTTRTVDTMNMNRVQLDKMIFIIDRLREGTLDDSGSTGY